MTGLKIKSDKVTLAGFPVTNLDIDLQGNEKTVNIGLFNLNYENNPLIVSGYFDYSPIKYDISVLAQNFNLNFLEANKDVELLILTLFFQVVMELQGIFC